MVVKYQNGDVWGYIDNVRQAAKREIDCENLLGEYNNDWTEAHKDDKELCPCSYMNSELLPEDVMAANKIFCQATLDQASWGHTVHTENLIDGKMALENYPAAVILLYLEDCKEYDSIALVTNQRCFLMNDKGQTIDRLM